MSPARPDDPLRKVTLNLYESDCTLAERTFGHGWTTQLREAWHQWLADRVVTHQRRKPLTLEDLNAQND